MLARIRKSMEEKDQGFTLIELLVVMIIIGILAAIAIPVFLNQQKKARDTAAKADVTAIAKSLTTYYVDGSNAVTLDSTTTTGKWTIKDGTTTVDSGLLSKNNTVPAATAVTGLGGTNATTWCAAVSTTDGNTWYVSSSKLLNSTGC